MIDPPESLRLAAPPPRALDWVVRQLGGSRAVSVRALRGGISHANHLIGVLGGNPAEAVLRRWVRPGWASEEPGFSPAQEAATYALIDAHDIPAPRLLAVDPAAECCDVPALLLTRAPGRRIVQPRDMRTFAGQLADTLTRIHALDGTEAARAVPPYRPYYGPDEFAIPAWSRRPEVWRAADEIASICRPDSPPVFIHRDYHQGNTLWLGSTLSAVVDWTSAEFGPAEVDVSHMRANLARAFSLEAADAFLAAVRSVSDGRPYDPWWDVQAVADWAPELTAGSFPRAQLLRMEALVARAIAELGLRPRG
jgi:aminoglycoside phosphotransferase (APT) family kinase protein